MEETVVRQLSFPNPDSSEKLVPERIEAKKPIFIFEQGTVIWSSTRRKGYIQNSSGIEATRIIDSRSGKPAKQQGLSLWQTRQEINLFFNKKHWELPKGYSFYAYARNAKKTKRFLITTK